MNVDDDAARGGDRDDAPPIASVLRGVDPSTVKMVRSLYDPPDARNLRDDLRAERARHPRAAIAVEMLPSSIEAQMCIRELLEDTPSMTAFSSERSALSKELLLFVVHVGGGCEITPELRSRASLVL